MTQTDKEVMPHTGFISAGDKTPPPTTVSEPGADLADLIARLETAQEGSQELDRVIAYTIGWWRTPEESVALIRKDLGREPSKAAKETFADPREFPPYTTSLDIALTLVPEEFGYGILVSRDRTDCRADLWGDETRDPFQSRGATAALSVCIACLKARAANPRREEG